MLLKSLLDIRFGPIMSGSRNYMVLMSGIKTAIPTAASQPSCLVEYQVLINGMTRI